MSISNLISYHFSHEKVQMYLPKRLTDDCHVFRMDGSEVVSFNCLYFVISIRILRIAFYNIKKSFQLMMEEGMMVILKRI